MASSLLLGRFRPCLVAGARDWTPCGVWIWGQPLEGTIAQGHLGQFLGELGEALGCRGARPSVELGQDVSHLLSALCDQGIVLVGGHWRAALMARRNLVALWHSSTSSAR